MEIKPIYCSFEQAKLFKEKGLLQYDKNDYLERPQQWEITEWLRINHGIWVSVGYSGDKTVYMMTTNLNGDILWNEKGFNSPQEAYSAAFDYVLKELI